MKPEKIDTMRPVNRQEERKLEDWQFLLATGIKVGCGYELLQMIRKNKVLQSNSETNQEL